MDRVTGLFKDLFESLLLFVLTFLLYGLFIVTFPVFRDPHGWIVMNDLPDLSKSILVERLLFGSACGCAFLGALLTAWAPSVRPAMMSNLWAATYFFLWFDSVSSLSAQFQTPKYLTALGLGLFFIYLFFISLGYLVPAEEAPLQPRVWKSDVVRYWTWGWIVFYIALSGILAYRSFSDASFQWPLVLGTMVVCFLYYRLYLFLERSEGKKIERISRAGRLLFIAWFISLLFAWMSSGWIG
jgi:hypothetical protein